MTHKAERGLFELRQGRAVYVTAQGGAGSALVTAVEGLTEERLEQLRSLGIPLRLVVTHHRAEAMGLHVGNGSAPPNVSLALDAKAKPKKILELATAAGLAPSLGARSVDARPASATEGAGVTLARLGKLVPAVVSVTKDAGLAPLAGWLTDGAVLDVPSAEIETAVSQLGIEVTHVSDALVPLADAENARLVFFREGGGFLEHVAVLIGARAEWPDPVPIRIHSACLTGDLFGSLRCDCGEQLRGSLRHFKESGGGILLYLAQEGRGIGLGNKVRAYTLQEQGLDTVEADETLGFGADERRYDAAVAMLQHLEIDRVRLLTNNPDKVRALQEGDIRVVERTPLLGRLNRHNLPYVQAKHRAGHWLLDMISEPISVD